MPNPKTNSTNQLNKKIVVTKCPVTFTLFKIGTRWKPLVINQLIVGAKRYGELKKAIPAISEKMLIQTLQELEEDGIISKEVVSVTPPHVQYQLTGCGEDLKGVLAAMVQWGLKYNQN
jgi:DNA-binding HxlR family transcriptional regulator